MLRCLAVLAVAIAVQGRTVNISNTWVLPEEGFPVFYRYFRDRISWYEADAVCQFHHANLVTVDTTAQYDAVRAYLKELDISNEVWVGLIRSNPDGDFTWTDYRGLSGDGYWSSAPDAQIAPLCAAANPAADYRWNAQACGGPMVASFICELPVPQWAIGSDGCMVRGLPALTALYLPESASVQLTVDCGQTGVRRVQCTGNIKRKELLRELSCEGDGVKSTHNLYELLIDTITSASTESTPTDEETPQELTTNEYSTTITQENTTMLPIITSTEPLQDTATLTPYIKVKPKEQLTKKIGVIEIKTNQKVNIIPNNNLQSNELLQQNQNYNFINEDHLNELEDEKHLQQKLLHDELARRGNLENIFNQPADHFIPPLVMAKAKMSDDMTVLSLREKHEQQMEEARIAKYNIKKYKNFHPDNKASLTVTADATIENVSEKALTPFSVTDTVKVENTKILKSHTPKKYFDKYYDLKSKNYKLDKIEKTIYKNVVPATTHFENVDITTKKDQLNIVDSTTIKTDLNYTTIPKDEPSIELTVILREPSPQNKSKFEQNINQHQRMSTQDIVLNNTGIVSDIPENHKESYKSNHKDEVVKVVIPKSESSTTPPIVFEVTTKKVINVSELHENPTQRPNEIKYPTVSSNLLADEHSISSTKNSDDFVQNVTRLSTSLDKTTQTEALETKIASTSHEISTEKYTNNETTTEKLKPNNEGIVIIDQDDTTISIGSTISSPSSSFRSPLLSSENEPLRVPVRSKRIQQPTHRLMKFSPFRILG